MDTLNLCMFEKLGCLSSEGPEILAFVSHCLANFQPLLECFIANFKLKYPDSENIIADCVNPVVFNLHQIECQAFLLSILCYLKSHYSERGFVLDF